MNELCGSNIATGYYAMSGAAYNEQLEENISKSDSSDSDTNADAVQELSDFVFVLLETAWVRIIISWLKILLVMRP